MNDRRRFLVVLGASTASLAPACGGSSGGDGFGGSSNGGAGTSSSSGSTVGTGGGASSSSAGGASSSSSSSSSASSSSGMGGAGGMGGMGGMGGTCTTAPGTFAGSVTEYANNGLYKVTAKTFLIGRDAGGLYAMSSICTHQACNLNQWGQINAGNMSIRCNCHGSLFSFNGAVEQGPAFSPLKHYLVTVDCMYNVYVDTSQVVDASQRTPA